MASEAIKKSRRIVMLRATWETQEALREWAKQYGFDLGWDYSGWPQASSWFDFHVTVVASANDVKIPDEVRAIDPLTLNPTGYEVLGVDRKVPALTLEPNATLAAIRDFFIKTYGITPTFADFKPHISLSYKWDGSPDIKTSAPAFPSFPLVFDLLMVATIDDDKPKAKDAAPTKGRTFAMADKAVISGTRRTADGYLVTEARVARGGNIQEYMGHEIGAEDAGKSFKVYRPEDEIFKRDSLSTFAHKPVTMGHPTVDVTPDTWRREAVGHVGSEVVRDGEFVRVPLVVMDAQAIADIEAGTREISMGYDCELVMQSGTTPDGRAYDAFQKNIRINHCAVVEAGRAGPQCRIGDRARIPQLKKDVTPMKTVTIDGKSFEVADEVAAHIAKQDADLTKAVATAKDAGTTIDSAAAVIDHLKREAADAKKAADDAKAAIPTADAVHAMALDLAGVIDKAKAIAPDLDTKGKAIPAIKRDAVAAKLGDAAIKDKSDEYVAATFDLLSARANDADPVADALSGNRIEGRDAARIAYEKTLYGNA
jgi:hypothetical protein